MAGYPFHANDLTPEEWEDLGRAEEFIRQGADARNQTQLIELLKRH